MRSIVREAIDAGALGFATSKASTHVGYGGKPVPSRAADLGEIQALAGALGEAGRGIVQATVGRELFFRSSRPSPGDGAADHVDGAAGRHDGAGLASRPARALAGAGAAGRARRAAGGVPAAELRVPVQGALPVREHVRCSADASADEEAKAACTPIRSSVAAFKESFDRPRPARCSPGRWARTWISWCPSEPALEERTVERGRGRARRAPDRPGPRSRARHEARSPLPDGGLQSRRGRGRASCCARAIPCSACPTPARTPASSATRASRPTCWATGCARQAGDRARARRFAC